MDINAVDFKGKTMLFHAINKTNFELTKYLIEKCNVNINITDNHGNLAFFYCQTIEMADYMINTCQMDVNIVNNRGQSVLLTPSLNITTIRYVNGTSNNVK